MITQIRKYPARCKSEDKNVAINMVHRDKKRKYMHIEFSINVIQTAKILYARVLYGKTIDMILTAENQSYVPMYVRLT